MFNVIIGGATYVVIFRHRTFGTECLIEDDNKHTLSIGQSHRVPSDPPIKAVGRKISLTRALKATSFDKKERTLVWEQYWIRSARRTKETSNG